MRSIAPKFAVLTIMITIGALFTGALSNAGDAPKAMDMVKPDMVCMVNDTIMDRTQIPVKVEGKTYYGCCNGCVAAIKNDPSVRFARDPLTGKMVDKAKAFIISGPRGAALYFESEESAQKYIASKKK